MNLRALRLGDQIRDIIGSCFQADNIRDPRLKGVTITAVKLSGDLQIATVYYRVFETFDKAEVCRGLESASGYLRKKLAENLDVRRVPTLKFFYDTSVETGSRIESILKDLKVGDKG